MKYYMIESKRCVNGKSILDKDGLVVIDFDNNKIYPAGRPDYDYDKGIEDLKKLGLYRVDVNVQPTNFWSHDAVEDKLREYCKLARLDVNYSVEFTIITEEEAFLEGV